MTVAGNPDRLDFWDDVTVIVVTYNSAPVIDDCLKSLANAKHIVVVDNASSDNTLDKVDALGTVDRVIRNPDNRGFGVANNQGFATVETEFALMINPDTIIGDGATAALVGTARRDANAIIVAPLLTDLEGALELPVMGPGERNHRALGIVPSGPFSTWFVTAAAWLCRMSHWRDVGGFDEAIFLYNEDADLCLRATAAGYHLIVEPRAIATHLGGRSVPSSGRVRRLKDWHQSWGHLYIEAKHGNAETARREARALVIRRGLKALLYLILIRLARFRGNWLKARAALAFLSGKGSRYR